ncbi:XdhC family protein [Crystallibacter degradans]|uniref:XdhC family protein n=1 Tax=Crystallibacter degradans TaxID=2726743 RepID=UPI001473993F|nr:XdhC/CoxI family protein [Arthrobacter sp. SF27]NMR30671.1 XdhC family protein [Arthrobacter sp. SF27]
MLNLGAELGAWLDAAGDNYAVATVIAASGSVPCPVGTSMLVSCSGSVLGSLSGGCVEGAIVAAALDTIADQRPRTEHFGYRPEDAFAVGLTCGGELDVRLQPVKATTNDDGGARLGAALTRLAASGPQEPLAVVRCIDAGGSGAVLVPDPQHFLPGDHADELESLTGSTSAARSAGVQLAGLLRQGVSGLLRLSPSEAECGDQPPALLVETRLPPPRLLVFGANNFSEALLPAAKLLGYRVTLCDARPAFTQQRRFRAADEVVCDWPHRYLAGEAAAGRIDARTVVCVLTHDAKFDIPLLRTALELDLAYLGAMGSQRSHAQRVQALLAEGVASQALARLHSPIGLDLQAVTPAEVAVSITAHIIASRNPAATGLPLSRRNGPIHSNLPVSSDALIHTLGSAHERVPETIGSAHSASFALSGRP